MVEQGGRMMLAGREGRTDGWIGEDKGYEADWLSILDPREEAIEG